MSDENGNLASSLGVQGDGEPSAVAENVTPPAETSGQEDGGNADGAPKKKQPGSARLKERLERVQQEAEFWKQQALGEKPEKPPEVPSSKPKADDFDSHDAYVEALADYKLEQKLAEREAKAQQAKAQETWAQKTEAGRAKYDDFDDALMSAVAPSPHVAAVLVDSPIGADLAYHLATHPDEYRRINSLGPVQAAREMGLLEARLTPAEDPEKNRSKKPTGAPPPLAPLKGTGTIAKDPNKMSDAEWYQERTAQRRR